MTTLLLTGLALTLGAAAPAPLPAPHGLPDFPVPAGPLDVPAQIEGRPTRIADLCDLYAAATGQTFLYSEEARSFLESGTVGLSASLTVPPERVQFVFETILIRNDFVLVALSDAEPRLLSLVSLNTGARTNIRGSARVIAAEDLERAREHPAMLFTTFVEMPNTDVRQLANSMRTLITDANTQNMLPAGNTNCLVLTGFGPAVADLARMLRAINELAPPPPPPPPAAPAEPGGEK